MTESAQLCTVIPTGTHYHNN